MPAIQDDDSTVAAAAAAAAAARSTLAMWPNLPHSRYQQVYFISSFMDSGLIYLDNWNVFGWYTRSWKKESLL